MSTIHFGQFFYDPKLQKNHYGTLKSIADLDLESTNSLSEKGLHLRFEPHPKYDTWINITAVNEQNEPLSDDSQGSISYKDPDKMVIQLSNAIQMFQSLQFIKLINRLGQ